MNMSFSLDEVPAFVKVGTIMPFRLNREYEIVPSTLGV